MVIWCLPSLSVSSVSGGAVPAALPSISTWPHGLTAMRTMPVAGGAAATAPRRASRSRASRVRLSRADSFGALLSFGPATTRGTAGVTLAATGGAALDAEAAFSLTSAKATGADALSAGTTEAMDEAFAGTVATTSAAGLAATSGGVSCDGLCDTTAHHDAATITRAAAAAPAHSRRARSGPASPPSAA